MLQKRPLLLTLVKQRQILLLKFDDNGDSSFLFVNGKKIMIKGNNKSLTFPSQFHLGSISEKFDKNGSREVSFKGNVYNFLVNYNVIDKSSVLNTYKHLMVENNVKMFL